MQKGLQAILKRKDGSLTVEAAVILPFVFSIIICISFFIKVAYTHMVVQDALSKSANEMAMCGYFYHLSGIEDKNNELTEKVESLFGGLLSDTYEGLKGKAFAPALKLVIGNKFKTSSSSSDERLKSLGVVGGLDGLDFSESRLFENQKDIKIIVAYKIKIATPINIIPEISVRQAACAGAWLGGQPNPGFEEANSSSESVWDLDNFARGRRIQKQMGSNLPSNFPVVCKNINGKITKISSINLCDKYYSNPEHLKKTIIYYINEIYRFKGAQYAGVTIKQEDIKSKELLIVVPEVAMSQGIRTALDNCTVHAKSKNVDLSIRAAFGRPQEGD